MRRGDKRVIKPDDILEICRLYASFEKTPVQIAKIYGIHRTTVFHYLKGLVVGGRKKYAKKRKSVLGIKKKKKILKKMRIKKENHRAGRPGRPKGSVNERSFVSKKPVVIAGVTIPQVKTYSEYLEDDRRKREQKGKLF